MNEGVARLGEIGKHGFEVVGTRREDCFVGEDLRLIGEGECDVGESGVVDEFDKVERKGRRGNLDRREMLNADKREAIEDLVEIVAAEKVQFLGIAGQNCIVAVSW